MTSSDPSNLEGGELLFLLRHGVTALQLAAATIEARRTGASPERALIAGGVLSEDAFYRALAHECRMPFLLRPLVTCAAEDVPVVIATGHARAAPGQPYGTVVAPGPAAIRLLAGLPLSDRVPRDFAMTTPRRLEAAVLGGAGPQVARHGSDSLPDASGIASYRGEARPSEARIGLAGVATATTATVIDPGMAMGLLQIVFSLLFLSAMALRLAAAAERPSPHRTVVPPGIPVPPYSVLVPLYKEGDAVIGELLAALSRLDYPRARLEILLLVEAGDTLTRQSLSGVVLPAGMRVVICPDGLPRTKPRALNIGLALSRGELLVVYDAEDRPEPAQLRLAAAAFARAGSEVGCLQAALAIHNGGDGWLARIFRLEYAMLFDVTMPGLTQLVLPVPLGGTSNHFRRSALAATGGWDAWNVTEDADIGLRLARSGFRTATLSSTTLEEAPATLRRWFPQRVRWMKGWMQTALVHSRNWRQPWPGGAVDRLAVVSHGWGAVLSALGGPLFLAMLVCDVLEGTSFNPKGLLELPGVALSWVVLSCGILTLMVPAILAAHRRRIRVGLLDGLLAIPYLALVSAAAWVALWELLDAPFRWNKTEHGPASDRPTCSAPAPSPLPRATSGG
jgi:hypothetical protein